MRKLSLRWRLTLAMTLLSACACLTMAVVSNHYAQVQMTDLADFSIEAADIMQNGELEIEIDPGLEDALNSRVHAQLRSLNRWIYLSSLLVICATAAGTYVLAGRILSPLRRFILQMDQVQAQNLSEPLQIPVSQDEIAQLTHTFNRMQQRLKASFDSQKQFASNAAHELRTPLAVLQTGLELLLKEPNAPREELLRKITDAHAQTERLSHLVSELLEMTRLDTIERKELIPLHAMLEELCCDLYCTAEEHQVSLRLTGGDAVVSANDTLLYRAFSNLIENAIKYNRPGGSVTVDIAPAEQSVSVTVTDTGVGIPPESAVLVFEPFYRVDPSHSRPGSGLGLALTKKILTLHNGTVEISKSTPAGTTVTVTLRAPASFPQKSRILLSNRGQTHG
ncbi:MAG: HAMP domain-containing sensor histidine kinase [Eubacteriales bacterium]|nr:HAMP domain-containing sensor histidine kinase [Eubacteriales bacterium]